LLTIGARHYHAGVIIVNFHDLREQFSIDIIAYLIALESVRYGVLNPHTFGNTIAIGARFGIDIIAYVIALDYT
jgi:hypothetical protein